MPIPSFFYKIANIWKRLLSLLYSRLIKPIFEIKGSPHSIALGVALGLWIAFTPTFGIQMILAIILCSVFRANILIAIAMTWVTNPVTVVPCYYTYYRTGLWIANDKPMTTEEFKKIIYNDYVLVLYPGNDDKEETAKISISEIKMQESISVYHAIDNQDSFNKIQRWLTENKYDKQLQLIKISENPLTKWTQKPENKQGVIVTWNELRHFHKITPDSHTKVVAEIKVDRTGWGMFMNTLTLGLTEIALYMWIGGLLIATVIAIPSYFVTYKAIIRFRNALTST